MKKALCIRLAAVMVLSLAVCLSSAAGASATAAAKAAAAAKAVKTGLSMTGSLADSFASGEEDGNAQTDTTIVAVTVDNNGVINDCVIDMIQARAGFDKNGKLLTDTSSVFLSKNEQAAAFAAYVKGKTIADIEGMGQFTPYVIDAVKKAEHLGASKGDRLVLASECTIPNSRDAAADADGQVQVYASACALTLNGDTITSCFIDALQGTVTFNDKGEITGDTKAAVDSKHVLGDAYGMRAASPIGKEWNEQASAFADYVTGKSLNDAAGIAISEAGKAEDADLAAVCSINMGSFINILNRLKNQ